MSGIQTHILIFVACAFAACATGLFARMWIARFYAKRRRNALRDSQQASQQASLEVSAQRAYKYGFALRYAETLTRNLFSGSSVALSPSVRQKRTEQTRTGAVFKKCSQEAGCSKEISLAGFCEARFRLSAIGALSGLLFGSFFSTELACVLGLACAVFAYTAPMRDVMKARRERSLGAEQHLSEMLEVVALGLRSGLTFDRSFALYGSHFDNEFALTCAKTHRRWALGLTTREEALRELASSYDCDQLARIIDSIIRSLRFGSALAGILEEAASQARATYRTALEERVAKAPVKMMLPTGALILPAMLLLVLGPILLELAGGF